ncbi:MAG: response regulator, partial [Pirellulaceae bacterium]
RLPDIFEMFVQVDSSLSRSRGGLGIGLTLVKRLVEMHQGTVEAASPGPGQGTQFTVRLPMVRSSGPSDEVSLKDAAGAAPAAIPLSVLVVDDNRDAADSLTRLLSCYQCRVATAYDGQTAIDMAQRGRPDVVLLDIGLPKLSGYQVAAFIRGQPWGKTMRLIALTGWGQEGDKERAKEAGFDHHLVKPVHPDNLLALLRS